MNRREIFRLAKPGAALIASSWLTAARATDGFVELIAGEASHKLYGNEGNPSLLWLYNGQSPGPVIKATQGERVRIRLTNRLTVPTSIHWHGVRIANAMDGVSGLTQKPVRPGEAFEYDFVVPDAGTYWYHAHHMSWNQVPRGLAGPLIIEEPQPLVGADQDITLLLCDWLLDEQGALEKTNFGSAHQFSHAGRLGNWLTVNGVSMPKIPMQTGRWHRVRIINASSARVLDIAPERFGASLIGFDGQTFDASRTLKGVHQLAPGQRMDLMMRPEQAGEIPFEMMSGKPFPFARFVVTGKHAGEMTLPLPKPNSLPEPNLAQARTVSLLMEGGAMGGMRELTYKGEQLRGHRFRETRQFWGLNGIAGLADEPVFDFKQGESIVINTENATAFPHAMHLHGHHFRVLSRNGKPVANSDWHDTFLIDTGEKVSISLVTDNPGKWLIHCHMLGHAASGMIAWFRVA